MGGTVVVAGDEMVEHHFADLNSGRSLGVEIVLRQEAKHSGDVARCGPTQHLLEV